MSQPAILTNWIHRISMVWSFVNTVSWFIGSVITKVRGNYLKLHHYILYRTRRIQYLKLHFSEISIVLISVNLITRTRIQYLKLHFIEIFIVSISVNLLHNKLVTDTSSWSELLVGWSGNCRKNSWLLLVGRLSAFVYISHILNWFINFILYFNFGGGK